jgi:hypothetical protein
MQMHGVRGNAGQLMVMAGGRLAVTPAARGPLAEGVSSSPTVERRDPAVQRAKGAGEPWLAASRSAVGAPA